MVNVGKYTIHYGCYMGNIQQTFPENSKEKEITIKILSLQIAPGISGCFFCYTYHVAKAPRCTAWHHTFVFIHVYPGSLLFHPMDAQTCRKQRAGYLEDTIRNLKDRLRSHQCCRISSPLFSTGVYTQALSKTQRFSQLIPRILSCANSYLPL